MLAHSSYIRSGMCNTYTHFTRTRTRTFILLFVHIRVYSMEILPLVYIPRKSVDEFVCTRPAHILDICCPKQSLSHTSSLQPPSLILFPTHTHTLSKRAAKEQYKRARSWFRFLSSCVRVIPCGPAIGGYAVCVCVCVCVFARARMRACVCACVHALAHAYTRAPGRMRARDRRVRA